MSDNAKALLLTGITAIGIHFLVSSYFAHQNTPAPDACDNKKSDNPIARALSQVSPGERRRLDVAFCIDTTGSMQGEIDTVKGTVKSLVANLTSGQPKPVVRLGLVAFRDVGDEYLTRVVPFSNDVNQFSSNISKLNADGGGDSPEEVGAGLHSAINDLKWDSGKKTARVIFLIGDAPPNNAKYDWKKEALNAASRGIRINTIACDELESLGGKPAFQKMASLTNGKFETLAYHQEIVDANGKRETFITSAGVTYSVKSEAKDEWKEGAENLLSRGLALQGATNGTIGPQGSDATLITGVNTAGTVMRADNNLDQVMLNGARAALESIGK